MQAITSSAPTRCLVCGRTLTDPDSIRRGIGPDCWAKLGGITAMHTPEYRNRSSSDVLLAMDWDTMNIRLQHRPNGIIETNVPHVHVQHSPSGFSWGYAGSGPSDLALNILALFLPVMKHPKTGRVMTRTIAVWKGPRVNKTAFDLYQKFKTDFLIRLDQQSNHIIPGDDIRAWLRQQGVTPIR